MDEFRESLLAVLSKCYIQLEDIRLINHVQMVKRTIKTARSRNLVGEIGIETEVEQSWQIHQWELSSVLKPKKKRTV
jgi:hypothetical protein